VDLESNYLGKVAVSPGIFQGFMELYASKKYKEC